MPRHPGCSQNQGAFASLGNTHAGSAAAVACSEEPLGPALTRLLEGLGQQGSTQAGQVMSYIMGLVGESAACSRGTSTSSSVAQQGKACQHGLPPPHLPPKS